MCSFAGYTYCRFCLLQFGELEASIICEYPVQFLIKQSQVLKTIQVLLESFSLYTLMLTTEEVMVGGVKEPADLN